MCFPQQWMDVGGGVYHTQSPNGGINQMYVYNNKLWCTGGFNVAGTVTGVLNLATWDGNEWDSIMQNNDYNGNIYAFQKFTDGKLYIGGLGWIHGNCISRWNDTTWENFTQGIYIGSINCLALYKNKLYAGGNFVEISGVMVKRIANWDGTNWGNVGGGITSGFLPEVHCMVVYNNELYVTGDIYSAGGINAYGIARWNDTVWNRVGKFGVAGNGIGPMVVDTLRNFLYVSGAPTWADGDTGTAVAQWDGKRWSFICHYNLNAVPKLCVYHDELYMSGIDPYILPNGDTLFGVVKWNGKNWKPVGRLSVWGTGTEGCMGPMVVYNDTLYYGGRCDSADNIPIHNIARWYSPPDTSCDALLGNYNKIWAKDTTFYSDSAAVAFDNNTSYADSWLWDFGDGKTDTLSEPIHIYDSAGTYNVSLITFYKYCTDTTYKTIVVLPCDSLYAGIYTPQGDTVMMQYYTSGGYWFADVYFYSNVPHADYWLWDFGDGTGDSSNVFPNTIHSSYLQSGTYTVTLVITYGSCIDTAYYTITVVKPTGINEVSNVNTEYLWQNIPNPFKNTTTIPYYVPNGSKGFLQITDAKGELVDEYALQQGKNKIEISLNGFKAGTYFYSMVIDGVIKQTKKMIVQ